MLSTDLAVTVFGEEIAILKSIADSIAAFLGGIEEAEGCAVQQVRTR